MSKNSKSQKMLHFGSKSEGKCVVMTDPQKWVQDEPSKNSKCQKRHDAAQKVREKCGSEGGSSEHEFEMIRRKNWKFAKMFQFWLDERISLKITRVEFKLWKKFIKKSKKTEKKMHVHT